MLKGWMSRSIHEKGKKYETIHTHIGNNQREYSMRFSGLSKEIDEEEIIEQDEERTKGDFRDNLFKLGVKMG